MALLTPRSSVCRTLSSYDEIWILLARRPSHQCRLQASRDHISHQSFSRLRSTRQYCSQSNPLACIRSTKPLGTVSKRSQHQQPSGNHDRYARNFSGSITRALAARKAEDNDEDIQKASQAVTKQVRSSLRKLRTREDIYNLPNFLTVTRLIAAPTTAYLLIHDYNTAALALFAYAGITDFIDGWAARRWKLSTVAGSVMDPMADKALMIILTATLAVKGALPLALATLILGRDASMGVAAIYYRWASLPPPKTFMRYWDFSLPSAEVRPTQVSKQNTFLQLILIGSTLALPVVTADNHHLGVLHDLGLSGLDLHASMVGLQFLVAGTTIWSGLSYAFNTDAVRMLPLSPEGVVTTLKDRRGLIGRSIIGVTFGAVILLAAYQANESVRKEMMPGADREVPRKTVA